MNIDNNVIYTNQLIEENGLDSTLTFKGTLGGEEKGEVRLACTQFYDNSSDLTILQISSVQAKILSGAGIPSGKSYWIYGKLIIRYVNSNGEEILNKIEFSDANTSTLKFSSLDTYYNLIDSNGVSHSLLIEIPAPSTVKKVEIKLEKTGSNSGFLFYETNSTPEYHWNILPANDTQEIELITNNQQNPSLPGHTSSFDVNSLFMGWCFARAIFQAGSPSAVAYLYNGVRLPKLPKWDKTTYPYAVIVAFPGKGLWTHAVTFFNALGYVPSEPNSSGRYAYTVPGGVTYKSYHLYPDEPDVWKEDFLSGPYESTTAFLVGWPEAPEAGIIWSSVDIVNDDESLHLEASDPAPVYE